MSDDFSVNEYWLQRGQTYFHEERLARPYHRMQETFLLAILKAAAIPLGRILELGCGYGRITRLLADHHPNARITALDLSPDQLAEARRYCAGHGNIEFYPYDFYSGTAFPGQSFDTALAIEVFLHHPPALVGDLVARLSCVARHIVHIDWSEDWPWPIPRHVWLHDYPAFYEKIGWACARFLLPEKAQGQQQVLFVAAPALSPDLAALERARSTLDPAIPNKDTQPETATPRSWEQQVRQTLLDLQIAVPQESRLILVGGVEWGMPDSWQGRRIIPFTEQAGQYAGPPADDATAWQELQRLRQTGATHLAIGWNAFWWRDHYPHWWRRIRAEFPSVFENDRLVVFELTR